MKMTHFLSCIYLNMIGKGQLFDAENQHFCVKRYVQRECKVWKIHFSWDILPTGERFCNKPLLNFDYYYYIGQLLDAFIWFAWFVIGQIANIQIANSEIKFKWKRLFNKNVIPQNFLKCQLAEISSRME